MTAEQRSYFFEVRRLLDELISKYNLTDENAFNSAAETINKNSIAFRTRTSEQSYKRGDVRIDPTDNTPYWAMHDHNSIKGQELQPCLTPTIWTHCHGTTPETARPFVAEGHNPYMKGHYCIENDIIYLCNTDNIVYAPSVLPSAWNN